MGDQEEEQSQPRSEASPDSSSKRKIEESIQLAKQRAEELAARWVTDAESKRPRLDESSQPSAPPISIHAPPFTGISNQVPFPTQPGQSYGVHGMSKKISIPNGKVGVIIGKGGETIKYIQLKSGAKIQITKDSEADPYSLTRDVELVGTSDQTSIAEQLINEVIAETDVGGSASSAVRGLNSLQPGAEQIIMKVPNNKVALLIGKGGETIKNIQSRSGARMQIIPLHLPPGDTSTERTVYINGLKEQIESAKELVNEVISGKRLNSSGPTSYVQPGYATSGNWGQPGQPSEQQQSQYGYEQQGTYAVPPSYYGNYPTQQAGWDQSNPSTVAQAPQQSTVYNYYGQQAQAGSVPPNPSYSYSQTPAVPSHSYDQNSQQPLNYGQNIPSQAPSLNQQNPYAASGYGPVSASSQSDGIVSAQSTQPSAAYPLAYSQPMANPQAGYWTSPSFMGQQPAQVGYDQAGFSHTGYGGQPTFPVPPPASQPVYGQGGYPQQPAPPAANYVQGIPPAQGQSQPSSNVFSQPPVYGSERSGDGNTGPSYGTAPVAQETVHLQS